jgi:hypothetical protein
MQALGQDGGQSCSPFQRGIDGWCPELIDQPLDYPRELLGKFDLPRTLAKVSRLRNCIYRGLRNTPKQAESGGNISVQETKSIIGALRLRLQPLNVKDFAWIFRVAEDTALKWIREGRVPAFRLGKTVRIDPHLLADMLQREVSDWEAKQELLDRRLKIIEKERNRADMAAPFTGEREGEE